jgi:hypothetical protein
MALTSKLLDEKVMDLAKEMLKKVMHYPCYQQSLHYNYTY